MLALHFNDVFNNGFGLYLNFSAGFDAEYYAKYLIVISGVIATIATMPNASMAMLPPTAEHTPIASGSRNVAVMGPLATPPESKAIAVNIGGTKKESIIAII